MSTADGFQFTGQGCKKVRARGLAAANVLSRAKSKLA